VNVDAAQQVRLLELADADAEIARLAHRAAHLPEQQAHEQLAADRRSAADRVAVLDLALEGVEAEVSRLEDEVDSVRRREDRDRALLDSGSVPAKQQSELQHELETLQRRQTSLEDTLLEVMERREQLVADRAAEQTAAEALGAELAAAAAARDGALAEIEQARAGALARREALAGELDSELMELYERQRAATGVGAGRLQAGRCGACRLELDRGELSRISAAPAEELLRCPECRAILVRPAA
jgi:predicted  nucleic acid-binding Zn-ribbon protein